MTEAVRLTDAMTVRLQVGAAAFVQAKALEAGTKPSEIARQALLAGLKAIGFDPASVPDRSAGALLDTIEGKQRWAWVDAGQIKEFGPHSVKAISYHDERPADDWLPVVHVDSEPFDIATQWRLNPVWTVEADRVVCTYPVVLKSLEHA